MIKKIFNNTFQSLKELLSKNRAITIMITISLVVGILCGVLFSASDISYVKILSTYNLNFIDYIVGSADLSLIFWNRFWIGLLGLILIFAANLNYYSSFLSLLYLTYQSSILTLFIIAVFSLYGPIVIILILICVVPINIILFLVLALFNVVCFDRAKTMHKYKVDFSHSFGSYYFANIGIILLLYLIVQVLINLIFPMLFRCIFIINY